MHVELGAIYKKQGQLAAAKESFQRAVNLQPKDAGHRTALAGALLEEGREQDALNEISQVDTPAMANYRMAHLYFTKQNVPQAQNYLASALRIDPNLQPARDLMNQLSGGGQIVQQAAGIYKNANNLYQNANGLIQATQQSVAAPGAGSMQTTLPPMSFADVGGRDTHEWRISQSCDSIGVSPPSSPAISTPNAPCIGFATELPLISLLMGDDPEDGTSLAIRRRESYIPLLPLVLLWNKRIDGDQRSTIDRCGKL